MKIALYSNLNGFYSIPCSRSTTYVASNSRDNVALLFGKRGGAAVLTIVFRNGGVNQMLALGHANAVQSVENDSVLSFKLEGYADCRLISFLAGTTFSAVNQ